MTVYARPGAADALMSFQSRYENFIGGQWTPPAGGQYFEALSPVNGQPFCEVARSTDAEKRSQVRWIEPYKYDLPSILAMQWTW